MEAQGNNMSLNTTKCDVDIRKDMSDNVVMQCHDPRDRRTAGKQRALPCPVACSRQPGFRREFWTMAGGIGSDLAIVDMGAWTGCLERIASLTLGAQVVLVDHTLTREELHVRAASQGYHQRSSSDCFSLLERLNVVSFLAVPGLSYRPHRMLGN